MVFTKSSAVKWLIALLIFRDLPDDPAVEWDTQLLATLVLKHIEAKNINLVMWHFLQHRQLPNYSWARVLGFPFPLEAFFGVSKVKMYLLPQESFLCYLVKNEQWRNFAFLTLQMVSAFWSNHVVMERAHLGFRLRYRLRFEAHWQMCVGELE